MVGRRIADVVAVWHLARPNKTQIGGKNSGDVGMALEAQMGDQRKQLFHFLAVLDVLGHHVFIGRPAWRPVDEQGVLFADGAWQTAQEIQPAP